MAQIEIDTLKKIDVCFANVPIEFGSFSKDQNTGMGKRLSRTWCAIL